MFVALNKNGLGMLSENEMRVFAVHAGFDGSDEEWRQEFQDLLASRDRDHGLSVLDFEHLVKLDWMGCIKTRACPVWGGVRHGVLVTGLTSAVCRCLIYQTVLS